MQLFLLSDLITIRGCRISRMVVKRFSPSAPWIYLLCLLLAGISLNIRAAPFECRPFEIAEYEYKGPAKFNKGLLWKVSREGSEPGHIFGTIHVDDRKVTELPVIVESSLLASKHFVMEAVPSYEDAVRLSSLMFFHDGRRLDGLIPQAAFDKVVEILKNYHMTEELVAILKPWAAFITMSYPVSTDTVLDVKLMQLARENGATITGLETVEEQISIFTGMELEDQVLMLMDVVCHYDQVRDDFVKMKTLYLDRDLRGLYIYGQRYLFEDNTVYDDISVRLIAQRNRLMVERMKPLLDNGGVFIAVGAMHLPGEEGILNLLERENYTITRIY